MGPFIPEEYRIWLEPDLERLSFRGRVTVSGRMDSACDEVRLDAVELAVRGCVAEQGAARLPCRVEVDPVRQELAVRLDAAVEGPLAVTIDYDGVLNDSMAGFYRSSYRTGAAERVIAVTQFEETDARRAFPCQDHPAAKATFEVEMTVADGLTAIANTPVDSRESAGDGRTRVRFAKTPPMPTYLVFFAAGDFEQAVDAADPRVRAWTVAGRIGQAAYGLRFGARALAACERLFRTPYPLPKLDLIAVPDFAFGAMENWGAITFRENLLLHVPGITSRAEEQRICEVVAHEIAHQWFGDLVTPSDWKYLWLNESFATLFGYRVVGEAHPEWRVWDEFLGGSVEGALARDGMRDSPAIEIAGDAPVVINTSNAPVLYGKGAAVLRQIEDHVGEEGFGRGLARYLRDHRCGNATSADFWKALDAEAGQPVSPIMAAWVTQPGYPLLTVERGRRELVVSQRRFTYLPGGGEQTWRVPLAIRLLGEDGSSRVVRTLLAKRRQRVELPEEPFACKLNAAQTGFYRVRYAATEDLRRLEQLAARGLLSPEDRWGLQNDLFALARSGEAPVEEYLRHVEACGNDPAPLPLSSIAGNLMQAFLVLEGAARERVAAAGRVLLARVLESTGLEPVEGEPVPTGLLRARTLLPAALFGVEAALGLGPRGLEDLAARRPIAADVHQPVLQIAAWTGGAEAYGRLLDRLRGSDSEQERLSVLQALGWLPSRGLLEQALDFALAEVPGRNRYVPIAAAAGNPRSYGWMWLWFQSRLADLEKLHRMHQERAIAAVVPRAGLDGGSEVAAALADYARRRPQLAQVVALSLEHREVNLRMRRANAAA